MSTDLAIGMVGLPTTGVISKKPSYLITLENWNGKNRTLIRFITLDKPILTSIGFVEAKGFFSEENEGEIIKNFQALLTNCEKDLILEMMFPQHRVYSIRSLVFKAK